MKRLLLSFLYIILFLQFVQAGRITGLIKDKQGNILPFASLMIKGSTNGTTANNEGRYFLNLQLGQYTIVCQYVGYTREEKTIVVTEEPLELDFVLSLQQLTLAEVVVTPGSEDPAYAIIRNAIKKRSYYLNEIDKFQTDVYIKGQLRLRDFPNKLFGKKIDFEDGDTSKKKVVYLSETFARYSVQKPNKSRVEVLSTRVSGNSESFGFSTAQMISFYQNIIKIGNNLNPRGFISPIAWNAMAYYRYRLEGVFFEDGVEINKIKVIPRRKYEPLFSGYINITEGEWRIHSLQLLLNKQSQLEYMDTVKIEQLYVPLNGKTWVMKTQLIYPSIKMMGFDAYGSFVNIYSGYDLDPVFPAKFFNSTLIKYNEGSNKKPSEHWDSIRPIPLQRDEMLDYRRKDSLEQVRRDPKYQDSIDRLRNRVTLMGVLFSGVSFSHQKKRQSYYINSLSRSVGYNTVEGPLFNFRSTWSKQLDTMNNRLSIAITPVIRYGFSNTHLNAYLLANYNYGKVNRSSLTLSGGKRVYQFNNENPISDISNVLATLYWEKNHIRLYEGWFGKIAMRNALGAGFDVFGNFTFQDRLPLENTTDWKIRDLDDRSFKPNYPEIMNSNFERHQASMLTVGLSWRPGVRFIEFPDRKFNMGSRYPLFTASITQGIPSLFGSDVSYARWQGGVSDNLNLNLKGSFSYNFTVGGFLYTDSLEVPDYKHFNGNQILTAQEYLNSYQLLPYYKYSNASRFFAEGHIEHHFNGMLTNKIPLFRKLNWHLVGGSNAFYVDGNNYYLEAFGGLENIFKIIRVDFLWGFEPNGRSTAGVRIGIRGFGGRDID